MEQVLAGKRVLDFGRFIAAPWCAALLGDLGAEVIRIEKRGGAEDRYISPVSSTGDGTMYLQCNRNKRSLTLDPMTPDGREIVEKLVRTADVVVVNLPQSTLEAMGLDYDSLRAIKPDIILTTGTAYGVGGPYSERVGYDGIGQVMTGGVWRSGTPELPIRSVVNYVDFGTAMCLFSGTLAALYHHDRTGEGQHVEGALLATALMMTNAMIMEQVVIKADRVAMGNRGPGAAPADLFRVKDGFVLCQIVGQQMFKRWCKLIGEEHLLDDPRYANDDLRGTNGTWLNDRMQAWCDGRTKEEVLAELDKARVPAAPVNSPQEAYDDEHVQAMGYFRDLDYPGLPRPAPVMEAPFRLSRTPGQIRDRAPLPGEHTDQVLGEIGFDEHQIADLRVRRII